MKLHTILNAPTTLNVILCLGKQRRVPRILHRPKFDLKKKLKEIMTSPTTGPFCVSENRDLFQQVMGEFYNYEFAVSGKS